jgi:hypothetical protein
MRIAGRIRIRKYDHFIYGAYKRTMLHYLIETVTNSRQNADDSDNACLFPGKFHK